MHQKLLEVLRCLSTVELNRLEKFLASPFFNTNERLLQLFIFLKDYAPAFDSQKIDLKKLFDFLLPAQKFDKQSIVRLNSQLFKLVETFISHQKLTSDPLRQELELLNFYETKVLDKHFQQTLTRLKKELEKSPYRNVTYYKWNLELESVIAQHLDKKDQRKGDINLQIENESLDLYLIIRKLKQLSTMLNRQHVIKTDYELTWMKELFQYIEEKNLDQVPTIAIYKTALALQLDPKTPGHYLQLKTLLEQYSGLFPAGELKVFYAYLANSIKHIFSVEQYFTAFFELYQLQLENGTLYHNGYILHTIFRNVVGAALGIGAYDWAEEFIQSHRKRILPESAREDAYYQLLANLRYYQGQPGKALDYLQKSNPQDVYYKLSQKSLLVKIFYDLRELESLRNILNNFAKTITDYKSKISTPKVTSYRKFINYTNEVFRAVCSPESQFAFEQKHTIYHKETIAHLCDIQHRIEQSDMFYSKKWLQEKIDELQNGKA